MVLLKVTTTIDHAETVPVPAAGAVHENEAEALLAAFTCVMPPLHDLIVRDFASALRAELPTLAAENEVGFDPENTATIQPRNVAPESVTE